MLSLIDVSLTGNLILIVVFSGYENFVSKIDPGGHPDWPDWMTKVNFGGTEAEAAGVDRRDLGDPGAEGLHEHRHACSTPNRLAWLVGVHLVFVVSAFMLAMSDRWSGGDHGGE